MRKRIVLVVTILLVSGIVFMLLWYRPYVRVTVQRELVGPEDEAIGFLWSGTSLSLDQVKALVQRSGKHVDEITWRGAALLYRAVWEQQHDVAEWLLQQGANPNGRDRSFPPLTAAVALEDLAMVRLLLAAGADPDIDTGNGRTPRSIAQSQGYAEILSLLPPKADSTAHEEPKPSTPSVPEGKPGD